MKTHLIKNVPRSVAEVLWFIFKMTHPSWEMIRGDVQPVCMLLHPHTDTQQRGFNIRVGIPSRLLVRRRLVDYIITFLSPIWICEHTNKNVLPKVETTELRAAWWSLIETIRTGGNLPVFPVEWLYCFKALRDSGCETNCLQILSPLIFQGYHWLCVGKLFFVFRFKRPYSLVYIHI